MSSSASCLAFAPVLPASRPGSALPRSCRKRLQQRRRHCVCARVSPFASEEASGPSPAPGVTGSEVTAPFLKWLSDAGMYLADESDWGRPPHALVIAEETTDEGEPCGRGLLARRPIGQGELLYEVPESVIMTREKAIDVFPEGLIPSDIDEYHAIALLLMRERALGDKSFFKPYLDILPKDEELTPLFRWEESDKSLLQGSPTLAAATSLSSKIESEYSQTKESILEKRPDVFDLDLFTYEAWEWAFAVLFSRAIALTTTGTLALVPYADLLNHSPYCATFIDMRPQSWFSDGAVVQYSDRQYERTQQVFVTYGPKSNGDLLLLYGFVLDRNPYDSVDITVALDAEDPLYDAKRDFLVQCNRPLAVTFPLYSDRYPKELLEFLRFCCASEEEMDADFGELVSTRNENEVAAALIVACRTALDSYPQSLEEDEKLVKDRAMYKLLTQNQRWAIKHRRSEKRILTRAIANIERERSNPSYLFTS